MKHVNNLRIYFFNQLLVHTFGCLKNIKKIINSFFVVLVLGVT